MFESFLHNNMFSAIRWILGIPSRAELDEDIDIPVEETHVIQHRGYENYEVIKPKPPPPTYKEILELPKLSKKQQQQIKNYHKYDTRSKSKDKDLGVDISPICQNPPKLGKK